jgi:hypothetical protein
MVDISMAPVLTGSMLCMHYKYDSSTSSKAASRIAKLYNVLVAVCNIHVLMTIPQFGVENYEH